MDTRTTPDDAGDQATAAPPTGCPVTDFGLLREQGPVVDFPWVGEHTAFMVTRRDDVHAMLTDPRFHSDAGAVSGTRNATTPLLEQLGIPADLDYLGRGLLTRDGADHTRLRKLVSRAFTVRRVNALRPRVEAIADELLDDVEAAATGGGTADLVTALAYPLPIAVICELVGVPRRDRAPWRELGRLMVSPAPDRMPDVAREVVAQVQRLVEARRESPADDLITGLVEAHSEDGDRLTEREMITLIFDLVTAGFETTAHLISQAALALLTRPDQLAALRADPGLWPQAVHELVRTCGPIPISLPRYPDQDVQVGDVTLAAGSTVLAGILTANFDPRAYDRATELDVRRATGRGEGHLGFGQGAHYCLGAALARQETEVALRALFGRFRDLRLAEPQDGQPSPLGFQRLPELPVRLG